MAKKNKVEKDIDQDELDQVDEEQKIDKVEVLTQVRKMNKKYGKVSTLDIKQRDPFVPRATEVDIRKAVMKMKSITANDLASRYEIRVSAIKQLLLTMELEGKLERITSSSRLKVFNPIQ